MYVIHYVCGLWLCPYCSRNPSTIVADLYGIIFKSLSYTKPLNAVSTHQCVFRLSVLISLSDVGESSEYKAEVCTYLWIR